jgi:CRISPR/Cas system CSM-associated protein Csm2 small subunit
MSELRREKTNTQKRKTSWIRKVYQSSTHRRLEKKRKG